LPKRVVMLLDRLRLDFDAVNMITVQYAKAFPDMRINAVEPGRRVSAGGRAWVSPVRSC